jgi:transcriptional regulatory protein RtcR
MKKSIVLFGLLGLYSDARHEDNPDKWRPTLSIFDKTNQASFPVARFHLIHNSDITDMAQSVKDEIQTVSRQTEIVLHRMDFKDPWDFAEVNDRLTQFLQSISFDVDNEDYCFHIVTGTHAWQIGVFLSVQLRRFPGALLQTIPPDQVKKGKRPLNIIDLKDTRYDDIANRLPEGKEKNIALLKSGIATKNVVYNSLIEKIEQVAITSKKPLLLTGATGVGKTWLAEKIYNLKKERKQLKGKFVEVNCGAIPEGMAEGQLFGYEKGAFTGAEKDYTGYLTEADGGLLFLDEIGELSPGLQVKLLKAIDQKRFRRLSANSDTVSDFQLICGTNRNLAEEVRQKRFREDLFARISLWTFVLPDLKDRKDDIPANIEFELKRWSAENGILCEFNNESLGIYEDFAKSPAALWKANFRDLHYSIERMCTMARIANTTRISKKIVLEEIKELQRSWADPVAPVIGDGRISVTLDDIERVQLEYVLKVCDQSSSMADAGRKLYSVSRLEKKSGNDSDRIKKYLDKYGLMWGKNGVEKKG